MLNDAAKLGVTVAEPVAAQLPAALAARLLQEFRGGGCGYFRRGEPAHAARIETQAALWDRRCRVWLISRPFT
ncbi:MAG: hypothetical protein ACLRZH_00935 [Ruthenibacterium lactatiformans]